jgi:hypothetical protein
MVFLNFFETTDELIDTIGVHEVRLFVLQDELITAKVRLKSASLIF